MCIWHVCESGVTVSHTQCDKSKKQKQHLLTGIAPWFSTLVVMVMWCMCLCVWVWLSTWKCMHSWNGVWKQADINTYVTVKTHVIMPCPDKEILNRCPGSHHNHSFLTEIRTIQSPEEKTTICPLLEPCGRVTPTAGLNSLSPSLQIQFWRVNPINTSMDQCCHSQIKSTASDWLTSHKKRLWLVDKSGPQPLIGQQIQLKGSWDYQWETNNNDDNNLFYP